VINNIASGTVVGIHQWHGATSSVIINNTVFHCKEGILIGEGDAGALPNGSENNYVANNIVYDNTVYGIIEYGKVGANNRYINNLVYKSGTNVKMQKGSVSGTILQDPLFVNYQANGSGDYHLQSSSPAIGKGAAASAPLTDLDGRPRQGGIDLGAYEFQQPSSGGGGSINPPVFVTSYSVLKTFHPLCDGRAGISIDCNSAVDSFCMAKGYKAGGFGPVEHAGDVAHVVCVNTGQAARFQTTLTALRGYQSLCNPNNPMSVECASAINRFCQNGHNYAAGGFGPVQILGDNVTVTCVTGSEATYRSDSWATLASYQEACTGQDRAPLDVCKAAVHRRCQALSYATGSRYVSGFGILEMNSNGYFSCLKY
ncbi:MAG: choice-of-anchor Q domain-containing protein, partial [Bdellovibrionia bacterium]